MRTLQVYKYFNLIIMPRIVTTKTKVFSFIELSKEGKEKAIENYYDISVGYDWWEIVEEDFKEQMNTKGFMISRIYFTGFASQGDGACFEGEMINLKRFLNSSKRQKEFKPFIELASEQDLTITTKQRGRYCHEQCMDVDVNSCSNFKDLSCPTITKFSTFMENTLKDNAVNLYKLLNKEYDRLTEDESIKDTLITNEYEFTVDGKIFN